MELLQDKWKKSCVRELLFCDKSWNYLILHTSWSTYIPYVVPQKPEEYSSIIVKMSCEFHKKGNSSSYSIIGFVFCHEVMIMKGNILKLAILERKLTWRSLSKEEAMIFVSYTRQGKKVSACHVTYVASTLPCFIVNRRLNISKLESKVRNLI